MDHRRPLTTLALAAALAVVASLFLVTPAHAGSAWPGHPDRTIVRHTVHPGDTATGLAVRYHAWTAELLALNHLGPRSVLHVGDVLRIPVVTSRAHPRRHTHHPHKKRGHTRSALDERMHAHGWRHWKHSRPQVRRIVARSARQHHVPVNLALAIAWQESGWHQPMVSSAGALGVMQVLPATGDWMALYAGRSLHLRGTHDNVLAGVLLLRVLRDHTHNTRQAIGAYYQGLAAVREHGLYQETRRYVANVVAIRDRLRAHGMPS